MSIELNIVSFDWVSFLEFHIIVCILSSLTGAACGAVNTALDHLSSDFGIFMVESYFVR